MKKKTWWWWLVILGIIALVILLVSRSVVPEAKLPAASAELPKPGYYTGGAVEFILTAEGEITRLSLSDLSFFYCSISWEDQDAFLVNNRYTLQDENSINIVYSTDGKFYINYSLTRCGTRHAWFARRGQYIAVWVSESPSSP